MNDAIRVLVHGWYGAGNVGDELLLQLIAQWCNQAGGQVTVMSAAPGHTRTVHGLDAIDASDLPSVAQAMAGADLFLLGGGGLFHTHYSLTLPALYSFDDAGIAAYARPALMAGQFGLPTVLWAQGVGPLDHADARRIVQQVFSTASVISVRDEDSARLLRSIGVDASLTVAPDPVWAMAVEQSSPDEGKPRLGLIVRPWRDDAWEHALVRALQSEVDPSCFRLAWIPFQPGDEEGRFASDLPLIERLVAQLPFFEHEILDIPRPSDASRVLASCDRLICMRLHAQILAHKLARNALCIEYDPKMAQASSMAGLADAARLHPDAAPSQWRERVAALLRDDLRPAVDTVAALEQAALAHRTVLHDAIAHARNSTRRPWTVGSFDWVEAWKGQWLHRRVAESEGRVAALKQYLKDQDALLAEARVRLAVLERAGEQREQQYAALNSTLSEAEARYVEAEQAVRDRDATIEVLRLEAEAQTRHHRQVARALQAEVGALTADVRSLTYKIANLEELSRSQAGELARIQGSVSWRLSYPLRVARALLVLPGPEKEQLLRSVARTVFWRLPEKARLGLLRMRARLRPHSTQRIAPALDAATMPDWVAAANAAPKLAIVPCAFEFDELANQRPINLAKYLAQAGYHVLFAAWQWRRGEILKRSNSEVSPGIRQIDLYDLIDHMADLAPRRVSGSLYFVTLPSPELVDLHHVARARGLAVVYDILDDWEAFHGVGQAPWYSSSHEQQAVLAADAVCAVSPPLAEKFGELRSDIRVIGNGYTASALGDGHKFCATRDASEGAELRIGYFGHLTDAWFDWDTVLDAARRMPHCRFEIIGYGEPAWVRDAAASLPNLHLLGKVPPADLWRHAQRWNVALAPFKPGPLAKAIDPIKVYEYLYLGLPTVCIGIPHLAQLPAVRVVADAEEFELACRELAQATLDYEAIDAVLETTTWRARFDAMLAAVPASGLGALYAA